MPTYGYRCENCGHEFEEFQLITASPLRKCPACGKNKLKRLLGTGGAILFKGSGFYITDYRSDSYQKAAKADSGTTPKDGGSPTKDSAKTTESAPAAKASTETPKKSPKKEK